MTSIVHCENCDYQGYMNLKPGHPISQEWCPECFAQGSLKIGTRILSNEVHQ